LFQSFPLHYIKTIKRVTPFLHPTISHNTYHHPAINLPHDSNNSSNPIVTQEEAAAPHNQPATELGRGAPGKVIQRPDFGAAFVPGAGPMKNAPKSLDHFQRGYEERAVQRDKEFYTARRPEGRNTGASFLRSGDREGTRFSNINNAEDPWNHHRDRPTILQGLDINALADRLNPLLNNKAALFAELDRTRAENRQVFDSGKALTALISIAARRKNIGLGHATWDWMDRAGIAKNTFHYNSMISVAEKARDYQHALALLQEMKDRNIKKNEVTYVFALCVDSGKRCVGSFCVSLVRTVSPARYPRVKNVVCGRKLCICWIPWWMKVCHGRRLPSMPRYRRVRKVWCRRRPVMSFNG
jgi:pentatricopeptide repeat protein